MRRMVKMYKLKDISNIMNVPIGILLVYVTYTREDCPKIVVTLALVLAFITLILYIMFFVHRADLWNRLKNKKHGYDLDKNVPDLAVEFERIKKELNKFTNKNDYGNIFNITSNKSVRNEGFKDGFEIFDTLKETFHNDIYKHFNDESNSFLKGGKNKKEDFVRLLEPLYRTLYRHECIVNSFLGLVKNGRYNISNDVDEEFNYFKRNYNIHLDKWKEFIDIVNIKLEENVTCNVYKIDDDKSLIELSKEEV